MKNSQVKAQEIASKEEVSQEIQQLLKDKNNLKKLVNYAKYLMIKYNYKISYMEPVDFVYNAIGKLLTGIRRWDKARFPDILNLILIIIMSEIRNESKKYSVNEKGNIKKYHFESIYEQNEEGFLRYENLIDTSVNIENDLIIKNTLDLAANILEKEGDEEAYLVLKRLITGMKNREIAEYLNIEVSRVENAVKRIKRVIKNLG